MEMIAQSGAGTLVIDTSLSLLPGAAFEVHRDDLRDPRHAAFDELVLWPTLQAVTELASSYGFEPRVLEPQMSDWEGCDDYRQGLRRAVLCERGVR
jgi:hypothetical protein